MGGALQWRGEQCQEVCAIAVFVTHLESILLARVSARELYSRTFNSLIKIHCSCVGLFQTVPLHGRILFGYMYCLYFSASHTLVNRAEFGE